MSGNSGSCVVCGFRRWNDSGLVGPTMSGLEFLADQTEKGTRFRVLTLLNEIRGNVWWCMENNRIKHQTNGRTQSMMCLAVGGVGQSVKISIQTIDEKLNVSTHDD